MELSTAIVSRSYSSFKLDLLSMLGRSWTMRFHCRSTFGVYSAGYLAAIGSSSISMRRSGRSYVVTIWGRSNRETPPQMQPESVHAWGISRAQSIQGGFAFRMRTVSASHTVFDEVAKLTRQLFRDNVDGGQPELHPYPHYRKLTEL